jgi:hypothetical protein
MIERSDIITSYNYDEFTAAKVKPWLNFDASPPLGRQAPDFPLWYLDGSTTTISEIWSGYQFTVVEFGSFT